jgi:hypothetical protein
LCSCFLGLRISQADSDPRPRLGSCTCVFVLLQAAADAWLAADAAALAAAAAAAAAAEAGEGAANGAASRRKQLRAPRPWQDLGTTVSADSRAAVVASKSYGMLGCTVHSDCVCVVSSCHTTSCIQQPLMSLLRLLHLPVWCPSCRRSWKLLAFPLSAAVAAAVLQQPPAAAVAATAAGCVSAQAAQRALAVCRARACC